nr:hypothetical protein GCM10020093_038270 [Planobispora longispora]
MDLAGTDIWGRAIALLEEPIFAVLLAVFLAFLGSQAGWRLVKLLLFCGAVGALVWAMVSYPSVGEAAGAIAGAVATIVLWLIAAVTVIVLAVLAGVLVMYVRAEPAAGADLRPSFPRGAGRRRWPSHPDVRGLREDLNGWEDPEVRGIQDGLDDWEDPDARGIRDGLDDEDRDDPAAHRTRSWSGTSGSAS